MSRAKKFKLNTIVSVLNKFVIVFSGLILPRLLLNNYGSEINGLTSSITQFLSIITFLDLGVGSVIQTALYKPLADNDAYQISAILTSARKYFQKIAYVLIVYVILLSLLYPLIVGNSLDAVAVIFLIFSMSLGTFGQYYFGIVNELLLDSDQKSYVQNTTEIIVVILNLIVSIILIKNGYSIVVVKLGSSLMYLVRPILLKLYVDKHYNVSTNLDLDYDPIKHKWSGMAQRIANTISNNTDIVVLTLFSTLKNVSVYSVYNMVVMGVKMLITSIVYNFQPFFGNLLAKNETDLLKRYFSNIEWGVHTLVIYLYGLTAVLILPFVQIYTSGIHDVDYYAPLFSLVLILAQTAYCIRLPYQQLVFAAGHYRQTQMSSIIEAIINVVISLLLVFKLGLVGVAIGTVCAMLYRILFLINYLSKNIINRKKSYFIKQFLVDWLSIGLVLLAGFLFNYSPDSFLTWIYYAFFMAVVILIILMVVNVIFYKEQITLMFTKISNK